MKRTRGLVVAAALCAVSAWAGERWRMRYFYDPPDGAQFEITGLAFPSAQHGIAVGYLVDGRRGKPYGVVTANGGETWAPVRTPEPAISLFFLNENTGWLVGDKNIWGTQDFGATWKKLDSPHNMVRVCFLDEQHGWAVGARKSVYETTDGGQHWRSVPAAAEPKTTPEYTTYSAIAFANSKSGMIAGWSKRSHPGDADWMDPDLRRREAPGLTVMLETRDSGATWKASEVSAFGRITDLSLSPDGRGLGLVEFFDQFTFPAEVYRLNWHTGKSERAFRRADRLITAVLASQSGCAYLAGIEPPGSLGRSPVPGKLKVLKSGDLSDWREMEVDYRAVARRALLAAAGPGDVWVATDTGMLLKLASE